MKTHDNINETKKPLKIVMQGYVLEQVTHFNYLDTIIEETRKIDNEINRKVEKLENCRIPLGPLFWERKATKTQPKSSHIFYCTRTLTTNNNSKIVAT